MQEFLINLLVPIITGVVYFIMALETIRVSRIRKFMFGEIGYQKLFNAFILLGIYFITRPLQNIIGPHPWPMIINSARQIFIMGLIAPAIFVGILHWVPGKSGAPRSSVVASYAIGLLMGIIFALTNSLAVDGSKIIATVGNFSLYDATWFSGDSKIQLVLIHLICQLVSPVGIILLAAAFVRHRRHNYMLGHIYTNMKTKWRYLETGLIILPGSFILSGLFAMFGRYYTYLWCIYFVGAIIAGFFVLYSIKLAPREKPADLV
ncbi:MAG: hypothetical protein IKO48_02820 [Elusimicrobia bacterium]|jgi:hypothetical protein|nr:hypothetical protein [Elusimicrobiota bacterium]